MLSAAIVNLTADNLVTCADVLNVPLYWFIFYIDQKCLNLPDNAWC